MFSSILVTLTLGLCFGLAASAGALIVLKISARQDEQKMFMELNNLMHSLRAMNAPATN
jgi:hypothetical protein